MGRVSDPYLSPSEAALLGVTRLELDELVATSDVVSRHAPALPETHHLIDRALVPQDRRSALVTSCGAVTRGVELPTREAV